MEMFHLKDSALFKLNSANTLYELSIGNLVVPELLPSVRHN